MIFKIKHPRIRPQPNPGIKPTDDRPHLPRRTVHFYPIRDTGPSDWRD